MAKFKAGDKVLHASGYGPLMIVEESFNDTEGVARCECSYWNAKESTFDTRRFPETALKSED